MDELRNETIMMRQSQMMWNHCRSSNEATADLQVKLRVSFKVVTEMFA